MNRFFTITLVSFVYSSLLALSADPKDAFERYFKAIEDKDKQLMEDTIYAPDDYKTNFVKVIDVIHQFSELEALLAEKYARPAKGVSPFQKFTQGLNKDLANRKFKITGNKAKSIPTQAKEVAVELIFVDGKWLLDMTRGQKAEALKIQGEAIGSSYSAIISQLEALIANMDALDTTKYNYEQAIRMVELKVLQALKGQQPKEQKKK